MFSLYTFLVILKMEWHHSLSNSATNPLTDTSVLTHFNWNSLWTNAEAEDLKISAWRLPKIDL